MSLNIFLRRKKNKSSANYPKDYIQIDISGYGLNITHNCNLCASKVLLHTPEKKTSRIYIADNLSLYSVLWYGDEHNIIQAKDAIPYIQEGLDELIRNMKYYEQFDSPNNYGNVLTLVKFCSMMLYSCRANPNAYLEFER